MAAAPTSPGSSGPVRDRLHVQREYGEQKWPAVLRLVEELADEEPAGGSALARVHRRVAREYAYPGDPRAPREVLLDGRRQALAACVGVGAAERLVADSVVAACTQDTDLVLELGSGWGWHVLGTWLTGGPGNALYVGAELTAAGRQAAERLAALDQGLRFRALEFDYHAPDLSSLGSFREAVVFSVHSIEQIPHLAPEAIRAVAGAADVVRCLHFEPVGWQAEGTDGAGRAHAERHDYNRDLLEVLRAEETAGTLGIDGIDTDLVGLNPDNPTTLVRWSARGR